MKLIITPRELMDRSLWREACDLIGISSWAVNEGQVGMDDDLPLTEDQARELGLLPDRPAGNS